MQQVGQEVAEKFKNKEKVKMSQRRCSYFKEAVKNSFSFFCESELPLSDYVGLGIQRFVSNKKEDFSS